MTAIDPSTCWAPVPTRWRHVRAGDITLAVTEDDEPPRLVPILAVGYSQAGVDVDYPDSGSIETATELDPDEMVDVLVPIPERDARRLTTEALGAWCIDRATDGRGVA